MMDNLEEPKIKWMGIVHYTYCDTCQKMITSEPTRLTHQEHQLVISYCFCSEECRAKFEAGLNAR